MISVIILYGGDSIESEISRQSAQEIIENIDQSKFSATILDIKAVSYTHLTLPTKDGV